MEDESPPTVTGDNPNQVLPKVEPSPSVPLGTLRALDGDVPDETTAARGEEVWSKEHPPVIFGMLDPPDTLRSIKHQTPGNIYNDNRRKVEGTDGAPLRDLPNLPRYISSKNEPVEMEFFFRADPRLGYNDIRSRQQEWRAYNNKKYKTSKAKKGGNPLRRPNNGINNARRRAVRGPLVMRDWSVKHEGRGSKVFLKLLDGLSAEQIDHNTTWIVTERGIHPPTNDQLVFPHFTFLANGYPHTPNTETQKSLELLHRLRKSAEEKGLGHWLELPKEELPSSWFKVVQRGKRTMKRELGSDDEDADDSDSNSSVDDNPPKKKKKVSRVSDIEKDLDLDAKIREVVASYFGKTDGQSSGQNTPVPGRGANHARLTRDTVTQGPATLTANNIRLMQGAITQGPAPPVNSNGTSRGRSNSDLEIKWTSAESKLISDLNKLPTLEFVPIFEATMAVRGKIFNTRDDLFREPTVQALSGIQYQFMRDLCALEADKWELIEQGARTGQSARQLNGRARSSSGNQMATQMIPQTGGQTGLQMVAQGGIHNGAHHGANNGAAQASYNNSMHHIAANGGQISPISSQDQIPMHRSLSMAALQNQGYALGQGTMGFHHSPIRPQAMFGQAFSMLQGNAMAHPHDEGFNYGSQPVTEYQQGVNDMPVNVRLPGRRPSIPLRPRSAASGAVQPDFTQITHPPEMQIPNGDLNQGHDYNEGDSDSGEDATTNAMNEGTSMSAEHTLY